MPPHYYEPLRQVAVADNPLVAVPGLELGMLGEKTSNLTLLLGTAYRSFGGEVRSSSNPTICRLPVSRRHQLPVIALPAWSESLIVRQS